MRASYLRILVVSTLLAIALPVVVLPAPSAHACSCLRPQPTPEEFFVKAAAVFTGTVMARVTGGKSPDGSQSSYRAVLAVRSVEKGDLSGITGVWTEQQSTACGYDFIVGSTYRIHAFQGKNGGLLAHACAPIERVWLSLPVDPSLYDVAGLPRPPVGFVVSMLALPAVVMTLAFAGLVWVFRRKPAA